MKAFLSISVQILLAVLITVISVLGVSSIIELNVLKHRETRTLQAKGGLTADRIANSLAYPLWNLNREATERVILDEIASADVSRIQVFDEDGGVYIGKLKGPDGAITNIDSANAVPTTAPSAAPYSFSREVTFKDTRIGSVTLDVTDAYLQAELSKLRWGIAIKLVLLVAILSVVLFVALRLLVIRPVSTLKSWVENIPSLSTDDFPVPRFKYSGEIHSLADAFGRMSLNLRRKNEELQGEQARLRELNRQMQAEIEERKQAEEELRTSESRFSKAFSLGPHRMGIIRLKDGVVLDVNDRWVQETGFQREEIIGRSIWDQSALFRNDAGTDIKQLLKAGRAFREVELHVTTKAGEDRVVLSSGEVFELRGEPCLLFAANDITERKQAEERISLLQMITIDVAAVSDLPSALEVVLRRVCEKTGWALGQAWIPNLKENTLDCCPAWYASGPGLDDFRNSTKHQTFRAGQGLPGRVWASGQPVWIRDVTQDTNFPRAEFAREAGLKAGLGIPIRSGDEVIAVIEFFLQEPHDKDERLVELISAVAAQIGLVVGRKRADEALRNSEERFSKAFSLAPYRMGIVRTRDGIILDVNDSWLREIGFTREEIIGHPIFELQAWFGEPWLSRLRHVLKEEKPVRDIEARINTRNGQERVVLLSAEVIEINNETCLLWATNDITERKHAEEQLMFSHQQLRAFSERLRRAKEDEGIRIARELHDELGSALTSLRWSLIGLKKVNSGSSPSAREKIAEMVELVDATINAVRRISAELRPGVLDDLGLVAAIEWHTQQFQMHTGIQCECESLVDDAGLNREQATVAFRILQEAMTNVLRHAQATKINVIIEDEDGEFVLEITDNGRGITESEKLGAHSLGLLGMRERANSIGGRIDITGTPGKGTKLIVRLPANAESAV